MLHDGPEIARRADWVGALPHAPLVRKAPKTCLRGVCFFHLWAHCVPRWPTHYTVCPEWLKREKIPNSFLVRRKNVEKSPKIPVAEATMGITTFFANATRRSRDSATRGQGGGSPPCTSCRKQAKNVSRRGEFIPPLGTLCTHMTHSLHSVPRMAESGKNS